MRILSLGLPLPDPQIDNYDWTKALSFFDYDAIIVEPAIAVSEMIEGIVRDGMSFTSYNEEAVENGQTTASTVGLTDLLHRRAEETERLLARGGLVICFAHPDVPHPRVSGFGGCHRYYWLPAPAGAAYGPPYLKPAGGTEVKATDFQHPFADFFERQRAMVEYRAVFGEGANGFGEAGKVIARSPGGAAVAVDLHVGGGRIVFLPALPSRLTSGDRAAVATALVAAARNLLLLDAEGPSPAWVSGFDLPGLRDAQERIDKAEAQIETIESELDEARDAYRSVDRYRRILWQEGKYGLDLPVRDALASLGMLNFSRPDEPAVFSFNGRQVYVETEGSTGAVGMTAHYRLRERVEREIALKGEAPLGLLVINGLRDTPPQSRGQQYETALKTAAETMSYAVIDTTSLFEALKVRLDGSAADVREFVEALIETKGVYEGPLPGGAEPEEDKSDDE
ncbi:MAG TPA: hypothetical protein VH951_00225 [Dehalococcoidia bacterium]